MKCARATDKKTEALRVRKETLQIERRRESIYQPGCYSHNCIHYECWSFYSAIVEILENAARMTLNEAKSASLPQLSKKKTQFNRYHLENVSFQLQVNTESSPLENRSAAVEQLPATRVCRCHSVYL